MSNMPWFPEFASPAFCETVQLRRSIIEREQLPRSSWLQVLEPSNAEFIAALAAGNNSHHIVQIGCGLSTIALAAAARATGSCLLSIHTDKDKQEIVNSHVKYLGLVEYVKFITDEPSNVVPQQDGVDFAFISGNPECYIDLFDLLRLKHGAIVVADNALDEAMNEYIKHVRRQPGIDSSTLPLGRGIEVTKITSWNEFKSGRVFYYQIGQERDEVNNGCNYQDMILPGGSFPSISCSKLNCPANDSQLKDSAQFKDNATKRNAKIDNLISAPPFQMADEPEGSRHGGYLEGLVTKPNGSNLCPYSIEGEGTCSDNCKLPETSERLDSIINGEEQEGCYMSVESCGYDSVLPIEKAVSLDRKSLKVESLLGTGMAEATSAQAVVKDLVLDSTHLLAVGTPERQFEDSRTIEYESEPEPEHMNSSICFQIRFRNDTSQTEVFIEGPDQDMLLTDITTAFNEMGISVQKARIATKEKCIEDVFYVIDAETEAPLDPSVWDTVRERMLQRILLHRKAAEE
eukprot:Gb_31211 [translate_table: standard]